MKVELTLGCAVGETVGVLSIRKQGDTPLIFQIDDGPRFYLEPDDHIALLQIVAAFGGES